MFVGEHAMKLGVGLPLSDIGGEPTTVRLFAQAAEAAGYDHLAAPDHVLGVNVASRPGGGARNTAAAQQRLSAGPPSAHNLAVIAWPSDSPRPVPRPSRRP